MRNLFADIPAMFIFLLFVVSLGLCWHFSQTDAGFDFYMLPTRAWELLVGCLGACVVRRRFVVLQRIGVLASGIGLWTVLYSTFSDV